MVGSDTAASGPLRLTELLASVSLATDLGIGQPLGHALRTCVLAVSLAEELGCGPEQVRTVHQFALLRFLGCTADSAESAALVGGDDRAFFGSMAPVVMGSPAEVVRRIAGSVAAGQAPARRVRHVARTLADLRHGGASMSAHCEVAEMLAISQRKAERDMLLARAWLKDRLDAGA